MIILQTIGYLFYFTLITFITFYIPGDLALKNIKLKYFDRIVLNILFGFVLWTWQSWFFGWLTIRWSTYIYLLVFLFFWIYFKRWHVLLHIPRMTKHVCFILGICTIGTLSMLHNAFFNNVWIGDTLVFFSAHPPDQIWLMALTNQLIKQIPPFQAGMYGQVVTNYHYFGPMAVSDIIRIFHTNLGVTVFQYFSVFLGITLGVSAVVLTNLLKTGRRMQYLLLLLLYFGGDILPYVLFVNGQGFHFRMGALESGSQFLMNYPRAFASIAFFTGLSLFVIWIKKQSLYTGILMALTLSLTFGYKANTGVLLAAGMSFLTLYFLYKKRIHMIFPIILFFLCSLSIYLPVNSGSGGLLFTGFWRSRDFIVHPELGLSRLELAREIFVNDNKWIKGLAFDLFFLMLYFVSIFGIKIVALFQTKRTLSRFPFELHILLISGMTISMIFGLFFIQETGGANSFNFIAVVFIVISLYAALSLDFILEKTPRKCTILVILLFIALTIPRSIYQSANSYSALAKGAMSQKLTGVSLDQMNYLKFIRSQSNAQDIFLTGDYFLSFIADRPVFLGSDSAYMILHEHNINTKNREQIVDQIMHNSEATIVAQLLQKNNIAYLLELPTSTESAQFIKQKTNGLYTIYRVDSSMLNQYLNTHAIIDL